MNKLTTEVRDTILESLSLHLDTRDKRYMFLKCNFKQLTSRIQLEGTSYDCAWNIYEEFEKQQMLGSLVATFNSIFETNLSLR